MHIQIFPVSILFVSIISSRRLQEMSSRCLQDMSWRRLEDVFGVTNFCLPRRFQDVLRDVFKTSGRRIGRCKIIRLKTCWRRLQDMSWRGLQHVFKTNKCFLGCNALLIQFTVETNWGRSATWLVHHDRFITSHNSYLRKRSKSEEANTECICASNDLW